MRSATIINEEIVVKGNVLIRDGKIWNMDALGRDHIADLTIDAKGAYLIPGAIDD